MNDVNNEDLFPNNTSEEVLKDKLSPIFKEKGLRLVILFGSAVSGKINKNSDIDIAFLFDNPVDILELTNAVIRLLHTDNVDVVDLRRASPLLKFSAIKKGKPLYEREPGIFNEFSSLAFRMYIDTKKLRDAHAITISNFLKERGIA